MMGIESDKLGCQIFAIIHPNNATANKNPHKLSKQCTICCHSHYSHPTTTTGICISFPCQSHKRTTLKSYSQVDSLWIKQRKNLNFKDGGGRMVDELVNSIVLIDLTDQVINHDSSLLGRDGWTGGKKKVHTPTNPLLPPVAQQKSDTSSAKSKVVAVVAIKLHGCLGWVLACDIHARMHTFRLVGLLEKSAEEAKLNEEDKTV